VLIFSVKYHALPAALEDAKKFIGENTILMSLLNGVESEEIIRRAYPNQHTLYSVIRIPSINQNGKISYPKGWGEISFGDACNKEISEDVQAVYDLFRSSQIGCRIPEDMLKNMWNKFMTNVSENQTCAMLKAPYGIFQISEEANHMRKVIAKEVIRIAQAKGVELTEEDLELHEKKVFSYPFEGKPSTMQDIENGRKTEVDMFAGAMIRMGKELGIPTPYNQILYDGIKALEAWNDHIR
jgi:2-dehydropantoate 2-reductase